MKTLIKQIAITSVTTWACLAGSPVQATQFGEVGFYMGDGYTYQVSSRKQGIESQRDNNIYFSGHFVTDVTSEFAYVLETASNERITFNSLGFNIGYNLPVDPFIDLFAGMGLGYSIGTTENAQERDGAAGLTAEAGVAYDVKEWFQLPMTVQLRYQYMPQYEYGEAVLGGNSVSLGGSFRF